MAQFDVIDDEGVSFVRITLDDETVRAERGALGYLSGDITVEAKLPSATKALKRLLAEQSLVRPAYSGTGVLNLESTYGGYHIFELGEDIWILESGSYWASDGSIRLSVARETVMTSLWSGEGLIDLQTKISGRGKVVLKSWGPVQAIELKNERMVVDGKYVLARTAGIKYRIKRATTSILGHLLSGERRLRVYEGTGRILLSSYPYWRFALMPNSLKR